MSLKLGLLREIGAKAGEIIVGVKQVNMGLRIRADCDQRPDKENNKKIVGSFHLINAGSGDYAALMSEFEGRLFRDAGELIDLIRAKQDPTQKTCTYILHRDLLGVEKT